LSPYDVVNIIWLGGFMFGVLCLAFRVWRLGFRV
jgi:hypothetical protein